MAIIYRTSVDVDADFSVYLTSNMRKAHIAIFLTDNISLAKGRDEIWYNADRMLTKAYAVYFTETGFEQLVACIVNDPKEAGWLVNDHSLKGKIGTK